MAQQEGLGGGQSFRYATSRKESADDDASLKSLTDRFGADNRSIKKLLVALVSSNTFLTVKP